MRMMSEHISEAETRCKCGCGFNSPDPLLLHKLEDIREHYNKVILINCVCRCQKHNDATPGSAKNSLHTKGQAADFHIDGVTPSEVYTYLDKRHTGGLGKYKTFTHIDVGANRRWEG